MEENAMVVFFMKRHYYQQNHIVSILFLFQGLCYIMFLSIHDVLIIYDTMEMCPLHFLSIVERSKTI